MHALLDDHAKCKQLRLIRSSLWNGRRVEMTSVIRMKLIYANAIDAQKRYVSTYIPNRILIRSI